MVRFDMRFVLTGLAIMSVLICAGILCLIIGAFLDPTASLFAVVGSMVWTTLGPFLLLASIFVSVVGVCLRLGGSRVLGGVVLALSLMSTVGAGYIVTRIIVAAKDAGADIDLLGTLKLGAMHEPSPDIVKVFNTVDGEDLRSAIYMPPNGVSSAPMAVYVHGGGFRDGSFTETAADLRWLADNGWLVISVEYRLFAEDRPTWDMAMRDVGCAVAWAVENASRFRGDPERLALLGDSAGGNLAINVGYAVTNGGAPKDCLSSIRKPKAIAVQYPAVDAMSIYEDGFPIPGFEPKSLIEGYIGGQPDHHPERIDAISSWTYISQEAPPTLVILPENDSLVVAHGTLAFVEEARSSGIDIELVRIPFANHVFNQLAANSLGNQIGRSVRLHFLNEHVR